MAALLLFLRQSTSELCSSRKQVKDTASLHEGYKGNTLTQPFSTMFLTWRCD
jgi:hypothetical protein